jgi:hypothetical protein
MFCFLEVGGWGSSVGNGGSGNGDVQVLLLVCFDYVFCTNLCIIVRIEMPYQPVTALIASVKITASRCCVSADGW